MARKKAKNNRAALPSRASNERGGPKLGSANVPPIQQVRRKEIIYNVGKSYASFLEAIRDSVSDRTILDKRVTFSFPDYLNEFRIIDIELKTETRGITFRIEGHDLYCLGFEKHSKRGTWYILDSENAKQIMPHGVNMGFGESYIKLGRPEKAKFGHFALVGAIYALDSTEDFNEMKKHIRNLCVIILESARFTTIGQEACKCMLEETNLPLIPEEWPNLIHNWEVMGANMIAQSNCQEAKDLPPPRDLGKEWYETITIKAPATQKITYPANEGSYSDLPNWKELSLVISNSLFDSLQSKEIAENKKKPEGKKEKAKNKDYSAGLVNLGNTCYMNSTIQCLHSVPELKSALLEYTQSSRRNDLEEISHHFTVATRDLFDELDKSSAPVAPMQFWTVLRTKFPELAEMRDDSFMQHDAAECWLRILNTLSQSLTSSSMDNLSAVEALFQIELASRMSDQATGEEHTKMDSTFTLQCSISENVNHLLEGLKHALKSEVQGTSPALGHSIMESQINSLRRYLTIQFDRVKWNRESNQPRKVFQKVDYPLELDVYDLCSDELKKKLEVARQDSSCMGGESLRTFQEVTLTKREMHTGIYELVAVLTHLGRDPKSGHYVAWVKKESGEWVGYDDDQWIPQREEAILGLSGGGDGHVAYICLYKASLSPI